MTKMRTSRKSKNQRSNTQLKEAQATLSRWDAHLARVRMALRIQLITMIREVVARMTLVETHHKTSLLLFVTRQSLR